MKISRKKNIQLKTRPTEGKLPTYVSYENNKFHHLYVVCMINFLSNFQLKVVGVSQDLFNAGTDTIPNVRSREHIHIAKWEVTRERSTIVVLTSMI